MSSNPCLFLPRPQALELQMEGVKPGALFVDTYDQAPAEMSRFRELNPFHVWPHASLPVPGRPGQWSRSIEGIWQGLKVISGEMDMRQFEEVPKKRPSDAERRQDPAYDYAASKFKYGDQTLALVKARFLIYAVAYLHLLEYVVSDELISEVARARRSGRRVIFFDWDSNGDILDPRFSYSHSSLLANWFNGRLKDALVTPAESVLSQNEFKHFLTNVDRYTGRYRRVLGEASHA